MTPTLLIALLTLVAGLAVVTGAAGADPPKGTVIAEAIVATWQCQDMLGVERTPAHLNPWGLKNYSRGYKVAKLNLWQRRHSRCATALTEVKRQWNWQAWLPDKWRRIGQCETQLNWQHYNSSYEGAFGFATQSWDSFKPAGYPDHASQASPWQQYIVALRIYDRYGFSGWGCRNA